MNIEMLLDEKEHDEFYRLAPHLNVPDQRKPYNIAKVAGIPDPLMATMVNWMHGEER